MIKEMSRKYKTEKLWIQNGSNIESETQASVSTCFDSYEGKKAMYTFL